MVIGSSHTGSRPPSPNKFYAAVKYRLCAPIYEKERKCPYCKKGSLDTLGNHAVACHGRGDMISRHDRLRGIFPACSAADLSPVCEQKKLIPETNSRPGDVCLHCWSAGQPAALDVTIISPVQPIIISNAARKSGFAWELRKTGSWSNIPTMWQHMCSI